MKLTINNVHFRIRKKNYKLDKKKNIRSIDFKDFKSSTDNNLLIRDVSLKQFKKLIKASLDNNPANAPLKLYLNVRNISKIKKYVKKELNYIEAAGGLVRKGKKLLFIYRLEHWDLPKGKIEKGETIAVAAIREVEEECGITVKLGEPLPDTWHSYPHKGKTTIKRTYWFEMDLIDDQNMKPQEEEGIMDVVWKKPSEISDTLENTFPNIKAIVEYYLSF